MRHYNGYDTISQQILRDILGCIRVQISSQILSIKKILNQVKSSYETNAPRKNLEAKQNFVETSRNLNFRLRRRCSACVVFSREDNRIRFIRGVRRVMEMLETNLPPISFLFRVFHF